MLTVGMVLSALENCIFEDLCEKNYYDNVISRMDTNILPKSYNTGATKLVLTPPGEDFVIKIPFSGEWWEPSEAFCQFEGAQEPNKWDYCKVETLQFQKAAEGGLGIFFAETKFIGSVHDYPIYIQPRVDIFEDTRDDEDYDEAIKEKTRDVCRKLKVGCFHPCWLSDFLNYFSEDTLKELEEHLNNNLISDLHGGNLGYLDNGQPVIVDYSDYWE